MKRLLCLPFLFLFIIQGFAQFGVQWSSAEILHELHKLNTVGRVLYIAAHPDDENTRLIAHLANNERVDVAYLSLTRGDGGQNLIGPEIGVELGLIRSQELLAARRIDGGKQFFSRAYDFGYSKSAQESFDKWGKDEILSDVVWVIRRYRPDIIINRFSHDDPRGHGHHTASAMLSVEAFDLAADPKAFPEQLKYVEVWQPRQLWHNVSTWWDKSLPERAKTDPSIISFDVGSYEPLLGRSMGEIASVSRSQHSSQGFGSLLQRGTNMEFLQLVKGETGRKSLFEEVEKSWSQLPGGSETGNLIKSVIARFDAQNPQASVAGLIEIANAISQMPVSRFSDSKLNHVHELITQCAGLWFEANTGYFKVMAGDSVKVDLTFLSRSDLDVVVKQAEINEVSEQIDHRLLRDKTHLVPLEIQVDKKHEPTRQYWLANEMERGRFRVEDPMLRGKAESDFPFQAKVQVSVEGYEYILKIPVVHKWADRAKGEQIRPLIVVPALTINPEETVVVVPNEQAATVQVRLRAHRGDISGEVRPGVPEGWECRPPAQQFDLQRKGEEIVLRFEFIPGKSAQNGLVSFRAETESGTFSLSEKEINYDHIPVQPLLYPSQVELVNFELATSGKRLAYLQGSGDDVPKALRAMGYDVSLIEPEDIGGTDLGVYDAIVTGIRAYNVHETLAGVNHHLMDYVKNGGNLIVQYNVSFGLVTEEIGPFGFTISRDRVTDEDAVARMVNPAHPMMNHPNKLTSSDFEGWVQERGLYFANSWDPQFEPLVEWADPGEEPFQGGLIVAPYGKGTFTYTGISFFRQLPAGVPGAYRLLANLLAGVKHEK